MSPPDTGEQRRDTGVQAVLAASSGVNRSYRFYAERAIAAFVWENDPFTADDVHREIPEGVEPHSPNVLPAVIRSAAQRGVIVQVGWSKSNRPSRHASMQRIWKGVQQ